MIFDDLKKINELKEDKNSKEYKTLMGKIQRKCEVEMIYFFTIKEMLAKYGIAPADKKEGRVYTDYVSSSLDINLMNVEALGCVRDQMALSASADGIVKYASDGSVMSFNKDQLIKHCIQNSESIFKMVQKHLAVENKSIAMSDDELYDMTEERLKLECSDGQISWTKSPVIMQQNQEDAEKYYEQVEQELKEAQESDDIEDEEIQLLKDKLNRAEEIVQDSQLDTVVRDSIFQSVSNMYDYMHSGTDTYGREGFSSYGTIDDDTKEPHKFLISPLMPEMQGFLNCSTMDPGFTRQNDFKNVVWDRCVYYADAHGYRYKGDYRSSTRVGFHAYPDKIFSYDFESGRLTDNLEYKNIKSKNSKYSFKNKDMGEIIFDASQLDYIKSDTEFRCTTSFQNLLAFKLANTIRKYSQQDLNENDYRMLRELSINVLKYGKTGTDNFDNIRNQKDFEELFDTIMTKIDDYNDYIDGVCRTMYEKSTHHEFQIHLQDVTNKYRMPNASHSKVIALYSEGDSRQDYDVARKQESRFNAVVAYARYGEYSSSEKRDNESNRLFQPMTGDIIGAGYEAYTIGDILEHAKAYSATDAESIGEVTSEDITRIKNFYNQYWSNSSRSKQNMTVIRKNDDLEKYVTESGEVNTNALLARLRKERDVVKSNMHIQFSSDVDNLKASLNSTMRGTLDNTSVNDFVKNLQTTLHNELLENYQLNVSEFKAHSYLYNRFYQNVKDNIQEVIDKNAIDPDATDLTKDDWNKIKAAIINVVGQDNDQFVSDICDDMFGRDNLLYIDQCVAYSSTPFLDSMIKLASNSTRCHYTSEPNEEDIKPHQIQFYFSTSNVPTDSLGSASNTLSVEQSIINAVEADSDTDIENDNTYDSENDEEDAAINASESDSSRYSQMFLEIKDTDKTLKYFNDDTEESIIYRATHPLQYQVLRNVRDSLNVKDEDVRISENGNVYVVSSGRANQQLMFKVGPIIDEEAFVLPMLDEDGNEVNEYVFEYGELVNPIMFGALDRKSVQPESQKAKTVNNRLYGLSAQITPYDGYDYKKGQSEFAHRVSFKSYQMGVLSEVNKCLDLYHLAKDSKTLNTEAEKQVFKRSKNALMYLEHNFFTNVYNTGTYIIENKEKCGIASLYLSNLIGKTEEERVKIITGKDAKDLPDYVVEGIKNTAEVFMAQTRSYRNRCVMPKIMLDQNIGLYNMVLNLDQNNCESVTGSIDRKNLLDSDCKSRRVAMFGTNDIFDTKLSGAAKRLGAIAFLRSHIDVDRLSGRVDRNTGREKTEHCELPGVGISDVYGRKEFAICEYDNTQAVDRFQLSTNGLLKALRMVPEVKFGMLNLTDNMEDGYVISKRLANRLGHFRQVTTNGDTVIYDYDEAIIGDKTGDSSAGNKGIIARIIDPDMKETDFVRQETINFFKSLAMSEGLRPKENEKLAKELVKVLGELNGEYGFTGKSAKGLTNMYKLISNLESRSDDADDLNRTKSGRNMLYDTICSYCMHNPDACPKFNSFLNNRLSVYLAFKNNPDVDVFMTNVCVLTRSNPDLVMHVAAIDDPNENTLYVEDVATHIISDDDSVNKNNIKAHVGGVGKCVLYLDSHTAEEKNRNYNDAESKKIGRGYGPQEFFAFDGTKCNGAFAKMLTYQDRIIVKNLDKMNKILMMNGLYYNYSNDFRIEKLNYGVDDEYQNIAHTSMQEFLSENTGLVDISKLAAEMIKKLNSNNTTKHGEVRYSKNIIDAIGKLNFDPVVRNDIKNNDVFERGSDQSSNMIQQLFYTIMSNGGAFVSMPESNILNDDISQCFNVYYDEIKAVDDDEVNTYLAYEDDYSSDDDSSSDDSDYDTMDMEDTGMFYYDDEADFDVTTKKQHTIDDYVQKLRDSHHIQNHLWTEFKDANSDKTKRYVPMFTSVSKISVGSEEDASMYKSQIRTQMQLFQKMLAFEMLNQLYVAESKQIKNIDDLKPSIAQAMDNLEFSIASTCQSISNDKSLSLDDLQDRFKSDIFRFNSTVSRTAVWSGDGAILNQDEVGISFKMAKELGLIRTHKKPLPEKAEELVALMSSPDYRASDYLVEPDNWDNAFKNGYSQIDPSAYLFVNRSPGQTTGCVRALKPRIINDDLESIKIHPSIATIFDGDFDGDTVGVIYFNKNKFGRSVTQINKSFEKYLLRDCEDKLMTEFEQSHRDTYETMALNQYANKLVNEFRKQFVLEFESKFIEALSDENKALYLNEKGDLKNDIRLSDDYRKAFTKYAKDVDVSGKVSSYIRSDEYKQLLDAYTGSENQLNDAIKIYKNSQTYLDAVEVYKQTNPVYASLMPIYAELKDYDQLVSEFKSAIDTAGSDIERQTIKDCIEVLERKDCQKLLRDNQEAFEVRQMYIDAMDEVSRTLTIPQNLIHPAEYDSIPSKIEGNEDVPYVNSLWFAQNADMGIGLYYAQQNRADAGNTASIYDELEENTVKANILDQYRQMMYEFSNELIQLSPGSSDFLKYSVKIFEAHQEQIERLCTYSDSVKEFHDKLIAKKPEGACYNIQNAVGRYVEMVNKHAVTELTANVDECQLRLHEHLADALSLEEFDKDKVAVNESIIKCLIDDVNNGVKEIQDKNIKYEPSSELLDTGKQYLKAANAYKDGLKGNQILVEYQNLAECLKDCITEASGADLRSTKTFEFMQDHVDDINKYLDNIKSIKDSSSKKGRLYKSEESKEPLASIIETAKTYVQAVNQITEAQNDKDVDRKTVMNERRELKEYCSKIAKTFDEDNMFDSVAKLETIDEENLQAKFMKSVSKINLCRVSDLAITDVYASRQRTEDDFFARVNDGPSFIENVRTIAESSAKKLAIENEKIYRNVSDIYTEAMSVANAKCFTAGETDFDKLDKIIREANISKKGKAPQLNALLSYSGVSDMLAVDKVNGKFALVNKDGSKITKEQRKYYRENLKMNAENAKSDVPKNKFRNDIESNIAAQSDKSDATGLGGAVAQKTQKQYASHGYGNVALKISGPITQRYLDAKQNVTACEKNLTIGKYSLDAVILFRRVKELQDDYVTDLVDDDGNSLETAYNADGEPIGRKAVASQVRNGQFTVSKDFVSINEGVAQLNNLLRVMDLGPLSPIDEEKLKASISRTIGADGNYDMPVANFAKKCDQQHNQGYRIMYNSNMPKVLDSMMKAHNSIMQDTLYDHCLEILKEKIDRNNQQSKAKSDLDIPLQKIIDDNSIKTVAEKSLMECDAEKKAQIKNPVRVKATRNTEATTSVKKAITQDRRSAAKEAEKVSDKNSSTPMSRRAMLFNTVQNLAAGAKEPKKNDPNKKY